MATPAGWKQGEDVIAAMAFSDEDAQKRFGGFDKKLPKVGYTKQPG